MNPITAAIVGNLCSFTAGWWIACGIQLKWLRLRTPGTLDQFHNLRPFYLPLTAVVYLATAARSHNLSDIPALALLCFNLAAWFYFKDAGGDDDRWKRRRKKLAEQITRIGARLTTAAVPT